MKITEHLYKTSGVEFGTNSNTFLLDCGDSLACFDTGYEKLQWDVMENTRKMWGLSEKPVSHVFVTHGHFDHAGNINRLNTMGARVLAADPDAEKIEQRYPEMEQLFGRPWVLGRVDERLQDQQIFEIGDRIRVTAIAAPGHSEGSFAFVIEVDGHRALCTGDMYYIRPKPPEDAVQIELAYMGGWDFSKSKFSRTLSRMSHLDCDILLPGHYYTWFGDVNRLSREAYRLLESQEGIQE